MWAKKQRREIVIVGAGIAGLATALALKRIGVQNFLVLERSPELRTTGAALTLFPNAWRALDALGVAHKLTLIYPAVQTGTVTNLDTGEKVGVDFNKHRGLKESGMGVRPLHRKMLLEVLSEELAPGAIRFSSKVASIRTKFLKGSSSVTILHLEDGTVIRTKVLLRCDGMQSMVAQWLGLAAPISSGRSAVRGLAIYQEGHGMKNVIHQFLLDGKRAGIVPLNDKEVYWFFTFCTALREREMAKEFTMDSSLILREVTDNLAKGFPRLFLDIVHHSDASSLTWAPLMLRAPWDIITMPNCKGMVTVAGDAMHPMTPDLGQGGCSALEDAIVFARNISHALSSEGRIISQKRMEEGIESYVKERRWRVAGLITGSYLSGWIQQGGSGLWGWGVRFLRDHVFYRFIYPRITAAFQYDCGILPDSVQ